MQRFLISIVTAAGMAFAGAALAAPPVKTGDSAKGTVLTTEKGMTLYQLARDPNGKSICNDRCETAWTPLKAKPAAEATGDYSIITREDGSQQWAYKGKPLYTWKNDKKPGDTSGNGFLYGAWHVAKP